MIFIVRDSDDFIIQAWYRKEFRELPEVSSQYIDNPETRSPLLNAERKSVNLCLEFVYMYMDLVCRAACNGR